jgi:transposase
MMSFHPQETLRKTASDLSTICRWLARTYSNGQQLVEMLTAERNRLGSMKDKARQDVQVHIEWLGKRLQDQDGDLEQRIHKTPVWQERMNLLRSVPGIRNAVSRVLVVELPELGQLSTRAISALVGLTPLNRDSGKMRRYSMRWSKQAQRGRLR